MPPLLDWQKETLDEALEEYKRHPNSGRPADEVIAELRAELSARRKN